MIPRLVYSTLLLGLCARGQHTTNPDIDPTALQDDMNTENLMSHLHTLQEIADSNSGNRAFGLPGYQASVNYIWSQISNIPGTKIWKQDFLGNFSSSEAQLRVGKVDVPVVAVLKSPQTPDSGIEAELVAGPPGGAGFACNETDYANLDVNGKIVLVERGACGEVHGGKVMAAARAGAIAVIQYDNRPGNSSLQPSYPEELPDYVPAGQINQADGQRLIAQLPSAGAPILAYFRQKQIREERTTRNIFAETRGEDEDSDVIMLGAHLDSVQTGPGINDNGSGSSLILELFRSVAKYRTKHKLRFAWWAAEENVGLGSRFYCYNLTEFPTEADKLLAYLNFDMVSRGSYYVGDGDGSTHGGQATPLGSEVIEKLWLDYFQGIGITAQEKRIGFDSDHFFFWQILQKPVGFLFTGVDPADDPCYHQACDGIGNVDPVMLTTNARAAAYMTAVLATNGTSLIPKSAGIVNTKRSLEEWGDGYSGCGHPH
ncbi:peptidase family M28 [Immersiella caudata]|uniref:Peptide hydrolase n=1 Tax=Immersiella caudata TaxID=314043 RepID=A0AA40C7L3_9PEZI|nr:peptidase family M28 [Immersiella caudata]